MSGRFHILYDNQHGSSGKGAAITRLADILGIKNASCNHGPNAGHWVRKSPGVDALFKALPSPAALGLVAEKPVPRLWVGPNSAFELEQIKKEMAWMNFRFGFGIDVLVHPRAAVTEQLHKDAEGPGGSLSTLHISSTMSGAGATYALKAMRQLNTRLAFEVEELRAEPDPEKYYDAVQAELASGCDFLHEVAQGFALSLDWGNHARHGTYRNASALQAAADFGIRPVQVGDVYCNLRTFPIRVGNNYDVGGAQVGYSGDFRPDQLELDWQTIGRNAEMPQEEIDLLFSKELTTVTKKLRRVATFSNSELKFGAAFNGATKLILNFPQYLHWSAVGVRGGREEYLRMHTLVRKFVEDVENAVNLPVVMIGTSAYHADYVLPYDSLDVNRANYRLPARPTFNASAFDAALAESADD